MNKDSETYKKPFISEELKENQKIYYEHLDEEYAKGIAYEVVEKIDKVWFRSELIGWENMPQRNRPGVPLIFATNHSGMAFPWDAIIFAYKYTDYVGIESNDAIRALSAPMLSKSALMNPFTIDGLWKKIGAIDATYKNFETMMYFEEKNLLIYPEGVPGIGKGFNRRYQLQELKTSFLRMSIKFKTDVVPFYCINGEYINPYSYNSNFINKIINKIGIPFLPLGIMTPFILLQPWIFYFAFPANLKFVLGKRIKPYEMIEKDYDEISQEEFKQLSAKIRKLMQSELDVNVKKYGKRPFRFGALIKNMLRNFKLLPHAFPTSWVIVFREFDKKYRKHKGKNVKIKTGFVRNFWLLIKNPFLIFYFIPILGLIPIAILGYRGNKLKNKFQNKQV